MSRITAFFRAHYRSIIVIAVALAIAVTFLYYHFPTRTVESFDDLPNEYRIRMQEQVEWIGIHFKPRFEAKEVNGVGIGENKWAPVQICRVGQTITLAHDSYSPPGEVEDYDSECFYRLTTDRVSVRTVTALYPIHRFIVKAEEPGVCVLVYTVRDYTHESELNFYYPILILSPFEVL